ncbi:MAG: hypothetical protein ABIS50_11765 [Luteolibacter sp.]|uniref:hypothetical protein n=1 Tax=Luteolibacter sp. TaxID=1962973 RepID=UPI0032671737
MEILRAKVSVCWLPVSCAVTAVICYLLFGPAARHALPAPSAKAADPGHPSAVSTNPPVVAKPSAAPPSNNSISRPPPARTSSDGKVVDWDTAQAMMKRRDSTTFTNNGTFPSGVGREMGLDDNQIQAVQTSLGRFWKTMAAETAKRARYDEEASDAGLKKDVYRIPALADRGQALRDGFQKDLATIAGEENAARLIKGMSHQPFGDFGKYDVVATFVPDEEFIEAGLGKDAIRVSYQYTDPASGAGILSGNSTLESFNESFGPWSLPRGKP